MRDFFFTFIPMKKQPIGLFDSGVGGTSIWKEVIQLLPNEDTIYLADSINAPYGQKSKEEIISLCIKNTELLISKGCKLIIVACNTATTNAIDYLRKTYDIPFIGIEPAIKPAALLSNTGSIGILATEGTLSSALFEKTSNKFTKDIVSIEQNGDGLVKLIENGMLNSSETKELLKQYLEPMLKFNIDHLVLGCTHYPYLIPQIKEIIPQHVVIIDSGAAVAKQTKAVLINHHLINSAKQKAQHKIYINTDASALHKLLEKVTVNFEIKEEDFLIDFKNKIAP